MGQAWSLNPGIMSLKNQPLVSVACWPERLALVVGTEAGLKLAFCSIAMALPPIKAVVPVLLVVTVAVVIIVTKRYLIAGGKS